MEGHNARIYQWGRYAFCSIARERPRHYLHNRFDLQTEHNKFKVRVRIGDVDLIGLNNSIYIN